jgi:Protein of unknown function (DUF3421)
MPRDVVNAGHDVCVGSVIDGESRIVATINLSQPSVFTKSRDTVLESTIFQVLAGKGFRWSKTFKNGKIPENAVQCGRNLDGEMCFIGRKMIEDKIIVGEISTNKRCMFLVHNTEVISVEAYEVLQHPNEWGKQALSRIPLETDTEQTYSWVAAQRRDTIPEDAIIAGWDSTVECNLYAGRFWSAGEVLPAIIFVDEKLFQVKYEGFANGFYSIFCFFRF